MRLISSELRRHRMRADNPWWSDGPDRVDYSDLKPRAYFESFSELVRQTDVRRAVVLMGPRRVGKTVLLHHVVSHLLSDHRYEPREVAYISLDQPLYTRLSIEEAAYEIRMASGNPRDPRVLVLDEIQYLADWERHLKAFVDTHPNVRCVVSGSAAAVLRLKSIESGAGRFTEFMLPPLTFYEYLNLQGIAGLVEHEVDNGYRLIDIDELNRHFIEYLNFGGYPEIIASPTIRSDFGRYIGADIVDKVLLRDIPRLYGIQDIQELNSLFTSLAYNTAGEVSLDELSRGSGVSKPTLKRYLEYLEAAFLIKVVHRIDRNARRFKRATHFKVYVTAPALRCALFGPVSAIDDAMGAVTETAVFAQWLHSDLALHYARWRSGEVDIVYLNNRQLPDWCVEVKWSDEHVNRLARLPSLRTFVKEHPTAKPLVTTRTVMKRGVIGPNDSRVDLVPVSLYCYIVGHRAVRDPSATATFRIAA